MPTEGATPTPEQIDEGRSRVPKGPVPLDPRYLAAVERLEAQPENQSGADKTWVEEAVRSVREHFARAVRVR